MKTQNLRMLADLWSLNTGRPRDRGLRGTASRATPRAPLSPSAAEPWPPNKDEVSPAVVPEESCWCGGMLEM